MCRGTNFSGHIILRHLQIKKEWIKQLTVVQLGEPNTKTANNNYREASVPD